MDPLHGFLEPSLFLPQVSSIIINSWKISTFCYYGYCYHYILYLLWIAISYYCIVHTLDCVVMFGLQKVNLEIPNCSWHIFVFSSKIDSNFMIGFVVFTSKYDFLSINPFMWIHINMRFLLFKINFIKSNFVTSEPNAHIIRCSFGFQENIGDVCLLQIEKEPGTLLHSSTVASKTFSTAIALYLSTGDKIKVFSEGKTLFIY